MKLSILPVSLFSDLSTGKMTLADWAAYAQGKGTDGFDASILFFPNSTATTIQTMKQQLEDKKVTIQPVMVCCYPDFTNPDPMERERQIDYFRRDLALISDFGFTHVRMTAGQAHPGLSIEEGTRNCVACFEKVLDTAEKYNVKLCLENHSKPGAWPNIDFAFNKDAFLSVFNAVKDMPIGINFDTANAVACGADAKELLETVIDKVWTIHMNDTATIGKWTPAPIGKGLVDFDTVFKVLGDHGFDGWICIEEASGLGLKGIDDAIAFARKYV
ncbi:MAG: sugar phosphate isomerase/epimerase [Lachnospiraceae bacterium]|nr:sugar phosphate isomerase/epimerase [Lachnospiraceae bacterium]